MFNRIASAIETGEKLVLMHFNADPDALGSAIALQQSFPDVAIGTYEAINPMARGLADALNVEVIINPDPGNYEKIVIVDTSTPSQLGPLADYIKDPIIIDHHAENSLWYPYFTGKRRYLCDETRPSCAEIVYRILKDAGKPITETSGIALLAGIISDTGRFRYADSGTFAAFSEIMHITDVSIETVLDILDNDSRNDISRKIAHLKAAQRIQYERVGDLVIAWTHIGSFEGSVARTLLSIGADVGLAISQSTNETRISGKASSRAVGCGIHLGKLFEELSQEYAGGGGGHAGAAGFNGTGAVNDIVQTVLKKTRTTLRECPEKKNTCSKDTTPST